MHNAQCCLTLMTHFLVAGVIKEVVLARRRTSCSWTCYIVWGEGKVFFNLIIQIYTM